MVKMPSSWAVVRMVEQGLKGEGAYQEQPLPPGQAADAAHMQAEYRLATAFLRLEHHCREHSHPIRHQPRARAREQVAEEIDREPPGGLFTRVPASDGEQAGGDEAGFAEA